MISVNTVMHSRHSIASMFVKSIKKLPFDFSVVYNTKKQSSLDIQRRKMKLLLKTITRRFKIPHIYFSLPVLFIQLKLHEGIFTGLPLAIQFANAFVCFFFSFFRVMKSLACHSPAKWCL